MTGSEKRGIQDTAARSGPSRMGGWAPRLRRLITLQDPVTLQRAARRLLPTNELVVRGSARGVIIPDIESR